VGTGQFIWYNAALSFSWMLIGGIGIGLLIGFIFMKVHKYLPTDANMDIVLTIITPYIMYMIAEEVHSSGVLAVVSGGLLLSHKRHLFLSSMSRLRGANVWESFVFVLNGIVFLLIGLDLPEIVAGLKQEGISVGSALGYGLLITGVLIVIRFISTFGAVFTTLIARNYITVADRRHPGWKAPIVLGWTGMRGVVSLAAALSIPVESNGAPFPQRNLILFITFIVILTTLVVQGLTLPYLIKKMKLPTFDDYIPEEEEEIIIKKELAKYSLNHLTTNYDGQIDNHALLRQMALKWREKSTEDFDEVVNAESKAIYLDVLNQQRKWLLDKNHTDNRFDEDVIRKFLHQIDIEEEKLRVM
jgi:CPA1 family monovalent cation:H+ antiporter